MSRCCKMCRIQAGLTKRKINIQAGREGESARKRQDKTSSGETISDETKTHLE